MTRVCAALLISVLAATSASAQSQGDWTVGLGLGAVLPKSGNGTLVGGEADIDDGYALTITAEYFFRDNWGVELLAATPFAHDINIAGVGFAGTGDQLPPTLSVNYHFPTTTAWKPYVGIGVNYTTFTDVDSPLGALDIDDSWGVAVQAGFDYALNDRDALRANIRWIDIDSDVKLGGAFIGEAEIDPIVVNLAYVRKF